MGLEGWKKLLESQDGGEGSGQTRHRKEAMQTNVSRWKYPRNIWKMVFILVL